MLTVYKYPVEIHDFFDLDLPADAPVLTAQMQGGRSFLWALVDPEQPTSKRRFRLAGTGHPINPGEGALDYIATFVLDGEGLVFHLFELLA